MTAGWEHEDPLCGPASSDSYWTTVNAGEAIQGVPSPLSYDWFHSGSELALRHCFADLGVLPREAAVVPDSDDERFTSIFFGRMVINVDSWRRVGDLMPGTSGDAIERQFFGTVRPGLESRPSKRRYPFVAVRFPVSLYLKQKRVRDLRQANADWRRDALGRLDGADLAAATAVLDEAFERFTCVLRHHVAASMLSQSLFDQLAKLAASAGKAGLELSLTTGYGSLEESAVLTELWRRGRAGEPVDSLAEHYGYYGPNSGDMESPSWREDPSAVASMAEKYRALPEDKSPAATDGRQARKRREAEAELLAALAAPKRGLARILIRLAALYLPLRETGRAALLMTNDVGRAAARIIGRHLVETGRLAEADEVFLFRHEEIIRGRTSAETAAQRRARRDEYRGLALPDAWQGVPEPRPIEAAPDESDVVIAGLGANDGIVEGVVRVVEDSGIDLEPGEILVCKTTDPSWASLLLMCGAAVIDIGGALSHGAIVARELGIPCVINTKDGSRRLKTGDRVRVDGGAGRVKRLETAANNPPTSTEGAHA